MFSNAFQSLCSVKVHFIDLRIKLSMCNHLSLLLNLLGDLTVRCHQHEAASGLTKSWISRYISWVCLWCQNVIYPRIFRLGSDLLNEQSNWNQCDSTWTRKRVKSSGWFPELENAPSSPGRVFWLERQKVLRTLVICKYFHFHHKPDKGSRSLCSTDSSYESASYTDAYFKAPTAFWGGKCSLCIRYTVKQAPNHKCQILNQICIFNSPKDLLVGEGLDSTGSGVLSWLSMQINSSHKVWIQISPEVNWGLDQMFHL